MRNVDTDTYQYPLGYIFGTNTYNNGRRVIQSYYADSTSVLTDGIYFIPQGLAKITILDGNISAGAFMNMTTATSITIPAVTSIGAYAFQNCDKITEIVTPDPTDPAKTIDATTNVIKYYDHAFENCYNFGKITFNPDVDEIGAYAFSGCSKLALGTITINSAITKIKESAFNSALGLTKVIIPDTVTEIANSAFSGSGLQEVTIGSSGYDSELRVIGDYAFFATRIKAITLPYAVTTIGDHAFMNSTTLAKIDNYSLCVLERGEVSNGYVAKYVVNDEDIVNHWEFVYNPADNTELYGLRGAITSIKGIVIPDTVTKISRETKVNLSLTNPASNEYSYHYISADCYVLIPASVTSIANNTFEAKSELFYQAQRDDISYNEMSKIKCYSETFPTVASYRNYWHYDEDGTTPIIWKVVYDKTGFVSGNVEVLEIYYDSDTNSYDYLTYDSVNDCYTLDATHAYYFLTTCLDKKLVVVGADIKGLDLNGHDIAALDVSGNAVFKLYDDVTTEESGNINVYDTSVLVLAGGNVNNVVLNTVTSELYLTGTPVIRGYVDQTLDNGELSKVYAKNDNVAYSGGNVNLVFKTYADDLVYVKDANSANKTSFRFDATGQAEGKTYNDYVSLKLDGSDLVISLDKHAFVYEMVGTDFVVYDAITGSPYGEANKATIEVAKKAAEADDYVFNFGSHEVAINSDKEGLTGLEEVFDISYQLYNGTAYEAVSDNKAINAGSYKAILTPNAKMYNVVGTPSALEFTFEIDKATFDITTLTFEDLEVTYDGTLHKIEIAEELPVGVTPHYANNESTAAQTLAAEVTFTVNSNFNEISGKLEAALKVNKLVLNITWTDTKVTYDNQAHNPTITLNNVVDGDTVNATLSAAITNAGTYTVTLDSIDNDNYAIPAENSVEFIVEKADYDMSAITFTSEEFEYDGTEHEINIAGTLPIGLDGDTVTVSYEYNKMTDVGELLAIATFATESNNYNVPEVMKAYIKVNQREITLTWGTLVFIYSNETKLPTVEAGNVIEGDEINLRVTSDRPSVEVGTYMATAIITNNNYKLPANYQAEFIVSAYAVVKPVADTTVFTYNGNPQKYELELNPLYRINNNVQTNAGTYTVTLELLDKTNYVWENSDNTDLEYEFVISKATFDAAKLAFESKTFTYSGIVNNLMLAIDGELPTEITYEYVNNNRRNVGEQEVTVTFNVGNNYNELPDMVATLKVVEKEIGITWGNLSFEYTGNVITPEAQATGLFEEDVCFLTVSGGKANVGEYVATVSALSNANYKLPAEVTANFVITPYVVELPTVIDRTYTYTGETLKYDITPSNYFNVSNDEHVDAGEYEVLVELADKINYVWNNELKNNDDLTYEFKINKAEFGMYNISFNDKTVTYNGMEQKLEIAGDTQGIIVPHYENNVLTNVGTTVATVTFTVTNDNYVVPEAMSGKLTVVKKELTPVWSNLVLTYNGEVQKPTLVLEGIVFGDQCEAVTTDGRKDVANVDYTIRIVSISNDNYEIKSNVFASYRIVEAIVYRPEAVTTEFVYNGEAQTYNLALSDLYQVMNNVQTNAGEYVVNVKLTDSKNYKWDNDSKADLAYEFVIGKASYDLSNIVFESQEFTYDRNSHSIQISGEMPVGYDGIATTVRYVNNRITNVGVVTVKAIFETTSTNYIIDGELEATITINSKPVGVVFGNTTLTYNGEYQSPSVRVTGVISGDLCSATSIGIAKDAGEHKATVVSLTNNNYVLAELPEGEEYSVEYVILKAIVEAPTAYDATFTYNGEKQEYVVKNSTLYDVTGNIQTNAGRYNVVVALKDKDNYLWNDDTTDDIVFSFVISKVTIDKPVKDDRSFTYTGEAFTYNIARNDLYRIENNVQFNAGTYNVVVSIIDKVNYEWTDKTTTDLSFSFVIAKAERNAPIGISGVNDVDNASVGKILGVTENMEYKAESGSYKAITGDTVTGLAQGKYQVRYKELDNYLASPAVEVTLANNKSTLSNNDSANPASIKIANSELGFTSDVEFEAELVKTSPEEPLAKIYAKVIPTDEKAVMAYEVKLYRHTDEGNVEIQPSDLAPGTVITVELVIPDEVKDFDFKILHIHNGSLVQTFTKDDYVINGSHVSFNTTSLSEFVFIYAAPHVFNAGLGFGVGIGSAVVAAMVVLGVMFFIMRRRYKLGL